VREGKRAVTRFSVLSRATDAAYLDVELFTGRTHQIRAHLADHGWPLFCDALYGGTRREGPDASEPVRRAAAALGRQGLHARRLAFPHPVTGAGVVCVAPLPPDLRAALRELELSSKE
jgi:23S rRNA pseudouridine1911/1915/1917 synthase